jgi:hypothetical protein
MNPHSPTHLIFDRNKKYDGEDSLFNKCCLENCMPACRKLKLDPCRSPCTSINSKWTKEFNIRPETLKQVKGRAWNTLEAMGIDHDILNRTQIAQQLKERIDFLKLKCCCTE